MKYFVSVILLVSLFSIGMVLTDSGKDSDDPNNLNRGPASESALASQGK